VGDCNEGRDPREVETLVPACCRAATRPYDTHTALCDTTRIVVQCTGGGVRHDAEDPRVLWPVDITHKVRVYI